MSNSITLINPIHEIGCTGLEPLSVPLRLSISVPLGLAALAAYLIERGIKINTCDMNLNEKLEEETEWYGITSTKRSRQNIKDLAKLNGELVFGGADPSIDPEYYLEIGKYIIRGEGEKALHDLITCKDISKTMNLSYKTSEGIIQHNQLGPLLDMNELPIPAYELFDIMKYGDISEKLRGLRWETISLARGCPYDCSFCTKSVYGRSWRTPTPNKAVDMIEKLLRLGELDGLLVGDSIFGIDLKWRSAVCKEIIRRKLNFQWHAYMRVDGISKKSLTLMKKAGCSALLYGLESGSQKSLDAMNKETTVEKGRRAAALTEESGIVPILSFILGIPGETEADLKETEEFYNELLDKHNCITIPNIYEPSKLTPFYEKYGPLMSEVPLERLNEYKTRMELRMKEKYGDVFDGTPIGRN